MKKRRRLQSNLAWAAGLSIIVACGGEVVSPPPPPPPPPPITQLKIELTRALPGTEAVALELRGPSPIDLTVTAPVSLLKHRELPGATAILLRGPIGLGPIASFRMPNGVQPSAYSVTLQHAAAGVSLGYRKLELDGFTVDLVPVR